MEHTQIGFLGIDQYGQHYNISKYPRKELSEQLTGQIRKIYTDTKSGKTQEVGYVIGDLWINIYRVCKWKEGQ
jgi:hypothetical protein